MRRRQRKTQSDRCTQIREYYFPKERAFDANGRSEFRGVAAEENQERNVKI
jgi:hypothetical protein